jgi:hypothetical protein
MNTILLSLFNFVPAIVLSSTSYRSLHKLRRWCRNQNRVLNARDIARWYVFFIKKNKKIAFFGSVWAVPAVLVTKSPSNTSNVFSEHQYYDYWPKEHRIICFSRNSFFLFSLFWFRFCSYYPRDLALCLPLVLSTPALLFNSQRVTCFRNVFLKLICFYFCFPTYITRAQLSKTGRMRACLMCQYFTRAKSHRGA